MEKTRLLERIIPGLDFVLVCVENVEVKQNRETHPAVLSPEGGEAAGRQKEEGEKRGGERKAKEVTGGEKVGEERIRK